MNIIQGFLLSFHHDDWVINVAKNEAERPAAEDIWMDWLKCIGVAGSLNVSIQVASKNK